MQCYTAINPSTFGRRFMADVVEFCHTGYFVATNGKFDTFVDCYGYVDDSM